MGTEIKEEKGKRLTFDEMRKQMNPYVQQSTKAVTGLGIKSIPYEQKKRFIEICDDQFNGNWGTGLAYLVSYYDDMQILTSVLQRIEYIDARLRLMEGEDIVETKQKIKLMNGVEVKPK